LTLGCPKAGYTSLLKGSEVMTHLGFNTQTFISLLLCEHLISFAIY